MINYKRAGVDIDKANLLLKKIKNLVPEIGGFSGLVPVDRKYKSPVLVTSCDGVGTKLKIATLLNRHNTIGIDLVAMVVNDIITTGARPLFLLDYFACGKLDVKVAEEVIKGIVKGCRIAGCKLHGGETAEMPGMYRIREYDLAGFGVGMIEKERIIDTSNIKAGDVLVGLPSSGIHSNGFSLVRKIFSKKELKKMGDELLTPTRIYVREVLSVISYLPTAISGIAHITGGGMIDNLYRIMPADLKAVVYKDNWTVPSIFKRIESKGRVKEREMYRTFNMGIGMVLVTRRKWVEKLRKRSKGVLLGEVVHGKRGVQLV